MIAVIDLKEMWFVLKFLDQYDKNIL